MQHTTSEWRKSFDEKFPEKFWNYSAGASYLMKGYIEDLLSDKVKRIRGVLESKRLYGKSKGIFLSTAANIQQALLKTNIESNNKVIDDLLADKELQIK